MSWEMLGHQWAVDLLQAHIANDRLRHAYLICGPSGVGRRTLALRFAQAINCQSPPAAGVPCGQCSTCRQFSAMEHPDLSLLRADPASGIIKVDQVREIQWSLNLSPYSATYRIGLILDFEKANPNAANAMLKTLEEPPSKVILLLTAESPESLLPTIASRCEIIRLRSLPLEQVTSGLVEKWHITEDQATLLAHVSGGRPGHALRLFQNPELLEARTQAITDLDRMLKATRIDRFAYAQQISSDREELSDILMKWASVFRDILLTMTGSQTPLINIDAAERIHDYANQLELTNVHRFIHQVEDTMEMLERYVNPRLAAEVLMLDLPRVHP